MRLFNIMDIIKDYCCITLKHVNLFCLKLYANGLESIQLKAWRYRNFPNKLYALIHNKTFEITLNGIYFQVVT